MDHAPIFRMYKLTIDAKDKQLFDDEGKNNLQTSIKNEPGTLAMYATHEDVAGTNNFVFEIYKDASNYNIHANSPQFKSYGKVAQQVLQGREVFQLQPQYLQNDLSLNLSSEDKLPIELFDFSIKEKQVKHWKHLIDEEIVSAAEILRGVATFYLATVNDDPTHWICLMVYKDQANWNASKSWFKNLLDDLNAKYDVHQLKIDTAVTQGNLEYNQLAE